jgi:type VI secretion system secreted protein Hcp
MILMTNKTILVMISAVFIVGFLTQNAFAASVDYYLKLDGIPGESTNDKHRDWLNLDSFSWGASNPASIGGGGHGTGKVVVQDFHFSAAVDKASPKLMEYATTGKHISTVVMELCHQGDRCYLTITLTDVLVSSWQMDGTAHDQPTEQVSLAFSKIEFQYKPESSDGQLDPPVTATYDLKKNVKV